MNRFPAIRYGFRASAKGIRYGVNTESATEPSQLLLLLFLSTVEPSPQRPPLIGTDESGLLGEVAVMGSH